MLELSATASWTLWLLWSRSNSVRWRLLCWHWLSSKSVLDFSSHGHESLFNVCGSLGTSFEEWNVQSLGKLLSSAAVNNLFGGEITLVTNQQLVDGFRSITINFAEPLLNVRERILIGHIIDNNDTVSTSVIAWSLLLFIVIQCCPIVLLKIETMLIFREWVTDIRKIHTLMSSLEEGFQLKLTLFWIVLDQH